MSRRRLGEAAKVLRGKTCSRLMDPRLQDHGALARLLARANLPTADRDALRATKHFARMASGRRYIYCGGIVVSAVPRRGHYKV
jgi:hypothetical protein